MTGSLSGKHSVLAARFFSVCKRSAPVCLLRRGSLRMSRLLRRSLSFGKEYDRLRIAITRPDRCIQGACICLLPFMHAQTAFPRG